ncbi:MAG: hypothetical protein JST92_03030 [Deltaproteobacteria bacterium]|nr:hypothetical protein [Deltaproteobacteria bacterium]
MPRALRWTLLASAAVLATVLALRPVDNFDLGFQLRIGEHVLTRGIPVTDPFSFPGEGKPWALEQWLGPALLQLAFRLGDIAGVIVFKALIAGAALALVTRAALLLSGNALAAAVGALLATVAAQVRFNAQANILSLLGLAAVLLACAQIHTARRVRPALWLLAVFAVWPHAHPGYLTGLVTLGAFCAGSLLLSIPALQRRLAPAPAPIPWRSLSLFGLGCVAISLGTLALFHPMGLAPFWHVLGIFRSATSRANIAEYAPLWDSYAVTAPLLLLWLVPPLAWALTRRPPPLALTLVSWLLAAQALQVGRLVSEAALAAAPVWSASVTALFAHLQASGQLDRLARSFSPARAAALVITCAALSAGLHLATPERHTLAWTEAYYPKSCYDWIDAAHLPPRAFNDLGYGGSFIFHFDGRRKTFIDGRSFYSDAFFNDEYTPIKQARPGFQRIAERWGIEWYLLHPSRFRALHEALQRDPRMALVHLEDMCAIYVLRSAWQPPPAPGDPRAP